MKTETQIISKTNLVIAQTIPFRTQVKSMAIYWILIELSWINDVLLALVPVFRGFRVIAILSKSRKTGN
jgi:hypothetical protein